MLNKNVYEVIKWAIAIVLPAFATLYTALGSIWRLPYAEEVPATVVAVETFLGAVFLIDNVRYNKNNVNK